MKQCNVEDLEAEVKFWREMRRLNKLCENAEALEEAAKKCREKANELQIALMPLLEKYEVSGGLECYSGREKGQG